MAAVEQRIGPIQALAVVTSGFSERSVTVRETVGTGYWAREVNVEKAIRGRECTAQVIALSAGGIVLNRINPLVQVKIGQHREATYTGDGAVNFSGRPDQEAAEILQGTILGVEPHMLVMGGHLIGRRDSNGAMPLQLEPFAWDLAQVEVHAPNRQFTPASGLVYDPAVLESFQLAAAQQTGNTVAQSA